MKKKLLVFFTVLCLILSVAMPAFADNEDDGIALISGETFDDLDDGGIAYRIADMNYYIVDDADLLTDSEETEIEKKLQKVSVDNLFDVVVVTTNDLNGKSPMEYADDYYDYNGYGQGVNHDGCLLLIHMDANRGYWISTTGYGITALTDYGIDCIGDEIVPYLSDGDYSHAFSTFADLVDKFVTQADTGKPYDVNNKYNYKKKFESKHLIYGVIAGLIIAFIIISVLKKQLKSVMSKPSASDYYVQDSLVITGAQDIFVGSHVTRTEKESKSGGSSTHTGSSGTSHGGGGGSF